MKNNETFNQSASSLIGTAFYNLPNWTIYIVLIIRAIIFTIIAYESCKKFEFFTQLDIFTPEFNNFVHYAIGLLSAFCIEAIITLFSLTTASFRMLGSNKKWYGFFTGATILAVGFNSYVIQEVSMVFDTKIPFYVFLTIHFLNIFSVILSEAVAFLIGEKNKLQQTNELDKVLAEKTALQTELTELTERFNTISEMNRMTVKNVQNEYIEKLQTYEKALTEMKSYEDLYHAANVEISNLKKQLSANETIDFTDELFVSR